MLLPVGVRIYAQVDRSNITVLYPVAIFLSAYEGNDMKGKDSPRSHMATEHTTSNGKVTYKNANSELPEWWKHTVLNSIT